MWSEEARAASIAARRAAAHQNGVDKVGKDHIDPRVAGIVAANPHGVSVTTKGDVPTKGYMVSQPGRTQYVGDADLGKNAHTTLNNYAAKNADLLKEKGAHIGVWRDPKTGQTHLDVSNNMTRQRDAVRTGKTRNQIAVWDVKRKRTINTGGTGG